MTTTDPSSATIAEANALRTEALEAILTERGVLAPGAVDDFIETWHDKIGPMFGARVVARAWTDPAFRDRLLADATTTVREVGVDPGRTEHLVAVADEPGVKNVVCCTLCSCYPWTVLGLPPAWYKSPEYRARIIRDPRTVLAEMGLTLDADTEIRVWDSSSEVRYVVVPERPAGTDGLDEDTLAQLVTRDSMIGVGLPSTPV